MLSMTSCIPECSPAGPDHEAAPTLLVFADDWGRHPSSCQHLIARLRHHYRVLWVNSIGTRQVKADGLTLRRGLEKLRSWQQGLRQVSEQMWVTDLPMLPGIGSSVVRPINRRLVAARLHAVLTRLGFTRPYVLTTLPYAHWLIGNLPRRGLIYYCTDDYSHWPSADRQALQQADRELCREADLILAASQALLRRREHSGRCRYFPHGVDLAHFAAARQEATLPRALASLDRPRIGFFGLIYEKLDFALLADVAKSYQHASLVMIGPVAFCPPEFANLPNVRLLGRCAYENLPRYIAGLDVLLLPYVDDPMIRQSGPLKLRECLASGKPTVSIDVPEVRLLEPHVRVAGDREEFLNHVQAALQEPADSPLGSARQRAVAQDGWDSRAAQLKAWLGSLQTPKRTALRPGNGVTARLPRILHLRTLSGKGGGPEKTILNSPRYLRGEYQLRLAYIRPASDDAFINERENQLGVDLVDIPEEGPIDLRTPWRLLQQVRDFRPDILHAHDYKTNLLAILLGRWFRIPALTTLHGYVARGGRLEAYYQVDRWSLRQMDHVVAVSDDLLQVVTRLGVPASRCSLVHNAIDTEHYARRLDTKEAKRRLGLNPDRLMVGAVGRLSKEKGFDCLIRAMDLLLNQGIDAELLLLGEGEAERGLFELVEQLGRRNRIKLLGYQANTIDYLHAMDVFALSSLREGLPNAVLEAMAMEVPVVATRVGGVPRLIQHGRNGLLAEPGNLHSLKVGIERLLTEPGLRANLRQAGRHTVETRFSFAVRMRRVASIYDQLLASKARPASKNGRTIPASIS